VPQAPAGLRVLPLQIDSVPACSEFMLRGLLPHIATSHLLVVQWDDCRLDAAQRYPQCLAFDCIERMQPAGPTFGLHGLFNLHRVMPPEALHTRLQGRPDSLARGLDAHDLCATLISPGRLDSATVLLDKRRRLRLHDRRTLRLRARLMLARWAARAQRAARR
jgi:hypothetical protein